MSTAPPAHAAAPVALATAATYSVLSGELVGNTACVGTIVRGDLGVSSSGAITGIGPGDGVVTGTIPSNNSQAIQNYRAGQTVANAVLTPVSATGAICRCSLSPADVVVDIYGWFSDTPPQSG